MTHPTRSAVLAYLEAHPGAGPSEVAAALGMAKSTAHGHLRALAELELPAAPVVSRDAVAALRALAEAALTLAAALAPRRGDDEPNGNAA